MKNTRITIFINKYKRYHNSKALYYNASLYIKNNDEESCHHYEAFFEVKNGKLTQIKKPIEDYKLKVSYLHYRREFDIGYFKKLPTKEVEFKWIARHLKIPERKFISKKILGDGLNGK